MGAADAADVVVEGAADVVDVVGVGVGAVAGEAADADGDETR